MTNVVSFMTAKDAAIKWNISQRRVSTLCTENRIEGAAMLGNMWIIPIDAEKPVDKRLRVNEKPKPFVKWAGGKGQLLDTLRKFYPLGLGVTIKKYCEPMVGAGAVLFDIINNYEMDEILICDSNKELINTYQVIKNNVEALIEMLEKFDSEHLNRLEEPRKEYYYHQREIFNKEILKPAEENAVTRAALFIYLNKTCFNGLYRVNGRGLFNVPMGSYKNPLICDRNNLLLVSEKLKKVEIICGDYSQVNDFVDENTFVYFDPPYRPLNKTSEFTSYNTDGFGDEEQTQLAQFITTLSERNVKVMASNSDPKNTNEDDNFFDDLYANLNINRVTAKRSINSKGKGRGKISELLICNY